MSFKASIVAGLVSAACTAFSNPVLAQAKPAGSTAVPASAAAEKPPVSKGEEQAIQWFQMLDTNKDGRVSEKETAWLTRVKPSLADEFKAADANHDGYVTQDEIRALADQRRTQREARRKQEQQGR